MPECCWKLSVDILFFFLAVSLYPTELPVCSSTHIANQSLGRNQRRIRDKYYGDNSDKCHAGNWWSPTDNERSITTLTLAIQPEMKPCDSWNNGKVMGGDEAHWQSRRATCQHATLPLSLSVGVCEREIASESLVTSACIFKTAAGRNHRLTVVYGLMPLE